LLTLTEKMMNQK